MCRCKCLCASVSGLCHVQICTYGSILVKLPWWLLQKNAAIRLWEKEWVSERGLRLHVWNHRNVISQLILEARKINEYIFHSKTHIYIRRWRKNNKGVMCDNKETGWQKKGRPLTFCGAYLEIIFKNISRHKPQSFQRVLTGLASV